MQAVSFCIVKVRAKAHSQAPSLISRMESSSGYYLIFL